MTIAFTTNMCPYPLVHLFYMFKEKTSQNMFLPILALILSVAPPAPPGATMVEVDVVRAEFQAIGEESEYPPSRRQSIGTRFSSFTGIAPGDIAVFVTDDPNNADTVDVRVDHTIPTGTSAASIASTLNNGILRGVDVLQAALTQTGGTIVRAIFAATVATRYVAVFPPPAPGPAFTETIIIVLTVGGVLALVALIFIARQCDAQKLNEFTKLVLGILSRVPGVGGARESSSPSTETRSTPLPPAPQVILTKRSVQTGAVALPLPSVPETLAIDHPMQLLTQNHNSANARVVEQHAIHT